MRVLITGGAGFVGSNLALFIRQEFPSSEVVVMDNLYRGGSKLNIPRLEQAGVKFVTGDVRYREQFPEGSFEIILECSAEPSVLAGIKESPDYLFQTNLVGAYQCLEKAREWGSHVIFLSTSRVYPVSVLESHGWIEESTRFSWIDDASGDGISSRGVSEAVNMDAPRSLYGYTKYSAEQLIMEYRNSFGLQATVNRFGVIAGPWQFGKSDQGVASLWAINHHFGRKLSYIGYGGEGKQVRDILHVQDLCEFVGHQIANLHDWDGWVGNVAGGAENAASLQELTAFCRKFTGQIVEIGSVKENRPSDLRIYVGDCSKLFARTDWRPKRGVAQTMEDIARWVKDHEHDLKNL